MALRLPMAVGSKAATSLSTRTSPGVRTPGSPGVRSARRRAESPTEGPVTLVSVDEPGQERLYLRGLATSLSAPQLIRRWRRRGWIAYGCRTLQPLLATEACQGHSEEA